MVSGKLALFALIVVAVLVPAPASARAGKEPEWHTAPCQAGAIDAFEVTDVGGQAFLTISGHLDCRVPDKRARFGYARNENPDTWGTMHPTDLRRYRKAPPTRFSEGRLVEDGAVSFTICLVTDPHTRVDCVGVYRDDTASPLRVEREKDDVRYSRPVRIIGDYRPACGGCW